MGDALERTLGAGQSLIVGRLDLLTSETKQLFRHGGTSVFVGAVALMGWIFLALGVIDGFAQHYPRFAVESAMGILHLGAALLVAVRVRTR